MGLRVKEALSLPIDVGIVVVRICKEAFSFGRSVSVEGKVVQDPDHPDSKGAIVPVSTGNFLSSDRRELDLKNNFFGFQIAVGDPLNRGEAVLELHLSFGEESLYSFLDISVDGGGKSFHC